MKNIKKSSFFYRGLCAALHPLCKRIADRMITMNLIPYKEEKIPENKPIIFVANHSNMHDIPIVLNIVKRHTFVLAGDEVKNDINGLAFKLNGVVWVRRKDKKSGEAATYKMLDLLSKKKSLLIFPEATWNLTQTLPMLPMYWGVIEIAQKTNALVVPITLEYTKDNDCYYSIGKAFNISASLSKSEAISILRDKMATMRWRFWEEFSVKKRSDITDEDLKEYTQYRTDEYPKANPEFEKTIILKKYDTFDEAFGHLEIIKCTLKTAFLFNKRLK